MRILLIDDVEVFRQDLQLWLSETLRHGVAVAGSVDEAREQLQQDRYDAILLDGCLRSSVNDQVNSNLNGGLEVLREMSPAQISKTIWMTIHHLGDLSDPARLGCNCFLFKKWISPSTDKDPHSGVFHQKLQGHLDRIAAERPNMWTTILGWFAILLVVIGVIWQMFEQFTPALFIVLVGAIVNIVSFWSILVGRPTHLFLRWRRR